MYLSRLTLDPRHPDTWRWLSDCHLLHRAIMTGFPHVEAEAARAALGVLYRVELPQEGEATVLVQSQAAPTWAFESRAVRADAAKPLDALLARIEVGARFRFRLRANPTRRVHRRATLGADLRELDTRGQWREACEIPLHQQTGTVRRREAEDERWIGKRVELTREDERLAWLARRGEERDGFALLSSRVITGLDHQGPAREYLASRADPGSKLAGTHCGLARMRAAGRDVDPRLSIATALFEGVLEVTDVTALRAAMVAGIGPGKAFGCGLLSLAPAPA